MTEYLEKGKINLRFDLRKLALWGESVAPNEVNFEWPTPKDLEMMSPDVGLHAIQFKTLAGETPAIASVLCVLTNG